MGHDPGAIISAATLAALAASTGLAAIIGRRRQARPANHLEALGRVTRKRVA